ncbi:MAG: hypothetical protein K6L81_10470 [Agarilytica sp.]
MNKWILIVAALAVGGAAFVQWQATHTSPAPQDDSLLAYIPADTVYYLGGQTTEEIADFFKNFPLSTSTPSQKAQMLSLVENWDAESSPKQKFFKALATKIVNIENNTVNQMATHLGISQTGPFALYSHGIAPVARIKITSPNALTTLVDEAVAESGWQFQEELINENTIRLWELTPPGEDVTVYFVMSTNSNTATFTFISSVDDDATKWERLGLTKPLHSLETSQEVANIETTYGFNHSFTGFIHFERLTQAFLNPQTNSFGKQLQQYLPEKDKVKMNESLTQACQHDYATLAAGMPRFVLGYEKLAIQNDRADMALNSIFEVKNASINQELIKLRGHIPSHALTAEDKIVYLGMGISLDHLTPVLTNLWTQFVNAPFTCDKLVQAQDQARKGNPSMLAMFMGMVQGIEGFGLSIYDVSWDETTPFVPQNISALASISAKNPQTLAGMSSMLPMLAGIQIPADGSPVDIPLPMVPPNISVKAAIKGQQLVVYSGDELEETLTTLAQEDLAPNGVYSFGLDYRRLPALGALNFGGLGGPGGCIIQQEVLHMFSQTPVDVSYLADNTINGLEGKASIRMDRMSETQLDLPGKYKLEYLNDACQWEFTGIEEIRSDNTGSYVEQDEAQRCNVFMSEYSWVQKRDHITMTPSKEASRETCDEELVEQELVPYDCALINIQADSFQCIFDAGTEDAALYRYSRI